MDRFNAFGLNCFKGSDPERHIAPILEKALVDHGTHMGFLCEVPRFKANSYKSILAGLGYNSDWAPSQFMQFWNPNVFVKVWFMSERLSEQEFYTQGGDKVYSYGSRAMLCDMSGHSLETLGYHLPAGVQHPENQRPRNRYIAGMESMSHIRHLAESSQAMGFLAQGDDNVHEEGNFREDFAHMRRAESGLRIVGPDYGTFGPERVIDEFRIPVGGGLKYVHNSMWTMPGTPAEKPSHKAVGATFRWAER